MEGGSGVRDMAPPTLENLFVYELSSLKRHSLILRLILHKSAIVILRQRFYLKHLIAIILLCLQCSLSKMRAP